MAFSRVGLGIACATILFAGLARAQPAPGGGLPAASPSVSEVTDGVHYQLDRFSIGGETLLSFKLGRTGRPAASTPLAMQAAALERLLALQAGERPLPARLQVRFGDTKDALTGLLQAKLEAPGANWSPRLGRPLRGDPGHVIQAELSRVVDASPLASGFLHRGYRLHLTGIARIEIGVPPSAKAMRLPTEIDEMDFVADKAR